MISRTHCDALRALYPKVIAVRVTKRGTPQNAVQKDASSCRNAYDIELGKPKAPGRVSFALCRPFQFPPPPPR